MKAALRLFAFVALLAVAAALAFLVFTHYMRRPPEGPVAYHDWIHGQLGISDEQDRRLEPVEHEFARRRDDLVRSIRAANEDLADALVTDKADSERVKAAVRKIHQAQGELQQAVLDHVFAMRPILTAKQYDRLIQHTADALRSAPRPEE